MAFTALSPLPRSGCGWGCDCRSAHDPRVGATLLDANDQALLDIDAIETAPILRDVKRFTTA
ncbi:hypothetical protein ACGF4C_14185 [Streptomyces sp. NPDC048197]|uniref:hypothetical protein n=1 Tax=Streptomyces sp. NPDC048197 TaxID=3365511 RepID=UPI00371F9381